MVFKRITTTLAIVLVFAIEVLGSAQDKPMDETKTGELPGYAELALEIPPDLAEFETPGHHLPLPVSDPPSDGLRLSTVTLLGTTAQVMVVVGSLSRGCPRHRFSELLHHAAVSIKGRSRP